MPGMQDAPHRACRTRRTGHAGRAAPGMQDAPHRACRTAPGMQDAPHRACAGRQHAGCAAPGMQDAPHRACNTHRTRTAAPRLTRASHAPHTRLVCSEPLPPLAIFRARLFASLLATRLVMFLKFEPLDAFFTT